ncbi:MAG: tRNA (guanosine(46)-N7)-methyltransferase TrmB [Gammaproteobacteria bacterium]|nr:tRNA (guanosine(46)-N7)-methyltransferase TrmB [Gammaproteobacteria bacterium]
MAENIFPRAIRSFVRRQGRITAAQTRALEALFPEYGVPYTEKQLDIAALFGRQAPCWLEIGFGNGENLVRLASQYPDCNFIGIEVHSPGVGRLLGELKKNNLRNLRVSRHDAKDVLTHQIPDASLDCLLLLFPDPWPKKRHHKRRIVQPEFVTLVANKLKTGGRFHLATDWANYAEHMLDVLSNEPLLHNCAPAGGYIRRPEERFPTKFEARGQALGHKVYDLLFERH